jgi:hypothetical protein
MTDAPYPSFSHARSILTPRDDSQNDLVEHRFVMPSHPTNSIVTSWLYSLLFVATTTGYPLAGALTTILTPGSQTISFAFRGSVIALSLILLITGLFKGQLTSMTKLVILFFLAGFARIFYDNFVSFVQDADKIGLYFIGTIVIPSLALGYCQSYYDSKKLIQMVFWYNAFVCILVSYINYSGVAGDGDITEKVGRLFFVSLNPTLIAYSGFFAIVSGYLISKKSSLSLKVIVIFISILSLNLMTLAISRGPWIALFFSFGYVAMKRRSFYIMGLMIGLGLALGLFLSDSALEPLAIFNRFTSVGVDQSSQERIFAVQRSIDGMLEYPFWGIAYVDPVALFYPHNLVIESGMALGVGGAAMMVIIQFRLLRACLAMRSDSELILGVFILTVLTTAYLSGSIWQSSDFWGVTALVLSLGASRRTVAVGPKVG